MQNLNPSESSAISVNGRPVERRGRWLKIAQIHDEIWQEGAFLENPRTFLSALRQSGLKADIFTFAQSLPDKEPKHAFHLEWDNLAVAPTSDFKAWWESLPQESRKNVRRAERRGVLVKLVELDDELVAGIKKIYDETPIRQGRRFWHYGKELSTIKKENSSYLDRSQFIGAYFQDELIGFIKIVFVGTTARIMQILSRNDHFDKRPTNALLARAAEVCNQRGIQHFIYGQYIYGKKANSQITEFKRRTGFEQVLVPRYYIPLTWKGRLALATKMHRGVKNLLPEKITETLSRLRLKIYERALTSKAPPISENTAAAESV